MIDSRPLRFVAGVLALWAGARALMLWPEGMYRGAPPDGLQPFRLDESNFAAAPASSVTIARDPPVELASRVGATSAQLSRPSFGGITEFAAAPPTDRDALLAQARGGSPLLAMLSLAGFRAGVAAAVIESDPRAPDPPKPGRLSGYGWLFVRQGNGTPGLADGGQLGGSQAGARLDYAFAPGFAVTGRLSTPIETRVGREAAIGLNWRPVRSIPLSLTIERRIALDKGGRNAFAAMAAGGVGPVTLPAGFALEAYGQAGIVGFKRPDGFVDGAATAAHTVLQADGATVAVGGGVWGAAQPGVSRLDVGPRVRFRLDRDGANIGASLDWRQRIAGNAEPRSGLAVTLDGSF
ncbi:hypothetical protein [Sphingomonas cavernae]|uniref:Uncharacterized protein n=1 Tax=Sphingomonas cavernae TaxID=2320861 RepID=A0A418W7S8_9SPHN|nr:hypothetical protein [Sphingomonas cavernae]RJF86058.1 hypothetical protein D3876_19720 [Sphingomonas cavernae]